MGWLETQAKEEDTRRQEDKVAPRKGYYGHLFKICNLLSSNSSKKQEVDKLINDERFTYSTRILVEREAEFQERKLGGMVKKENVHPIMYSKESILENYATFLSSAPAPVHERELDDPTMNPILLQELQRQLDGVEIVNERASEELIEEQHHKAELITENDHHKDAFWKMHLEYDVNGLMDDLN